MLHATLGILANPWRFLTQADTFINVLSSFGVFMSPAAAILVVDFWIVRKTKWDVPSLYTAEGIYWFWHGLNWRAFVAYMLGMTWSLPGFIQAMGGPVSGQAWYRVYQLAFFISYIGSGSVFWLLNRLVPPPGLGRQVDIDFSGAATTDDGVIHGRSLEKSEGTNVEARDIESESAELEGGHHNAEKGPRTNVA